MKKIAVLATILVLLAGPALAKGHDLALSVLRPTDLATLTAANVDSTADYLYVYDASAQNIVKVLAPSFWNSAATGTELSVLAGVTPGTVAASKALVVDSSLNLASINNLALTGTLGVTGTSTLGAITTTGVLTVDGVIVNKKMLSLPGRAEIAICGDGTTINNNTVYYGPSMVPVANAIRTCNTAQVGNATEASAQAKAFDNTAFQVLSMDCLTADPGAAGVSFTLRNSSAATVPSVTCSVANTKLGCTANVQTTTAIAAGNSIAIAAASTGDQGTTPFACVIHVAY